MTFPAMNLRCQLRILSRIQLASRSLSYKYQLIPLVIAFVLIQTAMAIPAVAQVPPVTTQLFVDCTGATPGAFTRINDALSVAGPIPLSLSPDLAPRMFLSQVKPTCSLDLGGDKTRTLVVQPAFPFRKAFIFTA